MFKIAECYQRLTNVRQTFVKRLPNDLLACKRLTNARLTFCWRSHDVYTQGIKGRWQTPLSSFFKCISAVNYCIIVYLNHTLLQSHHILLIVGRGRGRGKGKKISQEACKEVFLQKNAPPNPTPPHLPSDDASSHHDE